MRDRAWRRYIKELKTIRRLKRRLDSSYSYYHFTDVNSTYLMRYKPTLSQLIGSKEDFICREISTNKYDSKYKEKYSPNNNKIYWDSHKSPKKSRLSAKKEFFQILKENGIK